MENILDEKLSEILMPNPDEERLKIKDVDSKNKNVLILNMSTLPYKRPVVTYTYVYDRVDKKPKFEFICKSQLEAGTKTVFKLLDEQRESLDRIIILHTESCAKDADVEFKGVDGIIKISANDFYEKRIRAWIDGEVKDGLFKFVPIEKDIFTSANNIVNALGDFGPENTTVYIDTQGGRRNETLVMNLVLNMLKYRGIKIGAYIATDFNGDEKLPQPIQNVTLNNIMLDLVSAMKVFVETGRADELLKYYKEYKKAKNIDDDDDIPESNVIKKIKEFADYLSVCNMNVAREKLTELKIAINAYQKSEMEKDPVFKYLINDLENEYMDVFAENHTVADEIKWCLKHKFLQQALTLTEAHLPSQFIKDVINNSDECINEVEKYYNKHYGEKKFKYSDIYKYRDGAYLVINKMLIALRKKSLNVHTICPINSPRYKKDNEMVTDDICMVQVNKKVYDEKEINEILKKYSDVKDYRNQLNHANADFDSEKIETLINAMLKLIK